VTSTAVRATVTAVTRPTIRAILEDGPRAGETVDVDAASQDAPPPQLLLGDEHLGERPADKPKSPPSGSVSTYHLVGPDESKGGYVYRVAHTD
jgi:hypothetical protein